MTVLDELRSHVLKAADRGDEQYAHVSDLYKCTRETWARRNAAAREEHSPQTRIKFALGNSVEDLVAAALPECRRNVRLAITVDNGRIAAREIKHNDVPHAYEIVGHIDLIDQRFGVIEVKSTSFLRGRAPEELRWHYDVQASTYALGAAAAGLIDEPLARVPIICRESGKAVEFIASGRLLEPWLCERIRQVLVLTEPGAPMPPAEPPAEIANWACKYCVFGACEKNKAVRA